MASQKSLDYADFFGSELAKPTICIMYRTEQNRRDRVTLWINRIGIALFTMVSLCAAAAEPSAADNGATVASSNRTESQQHAHDLLMQMAQYLSGLPQFSVTVQAGYDVLQEDGEKIQFLEQREVRINRPNRFRMTGVLEDGSHDDVVFDGSKITILHGASKVFAQANQPATIDDGLIYFLRDLHMRLPLAPLFMSALPTELERRITSIDYVQTTSATGAPTHQVAARMNTGVDVQVWIATSDKPLPQRIVLTYRDAPGAPQFWAEFTHWDLQPDFDAETFRFDAPKDAQQIPFAVQFPASVEQTAHPAAPQPGSNQP